MFVLLLGVAGYLRWVGIQPDERQPGTRLAGTLTALPGDVAPVADVAQVHLETYPWFGIPFSVTTVIVEHNNTLYIPSLYDAPAEFPGTKYWNEVVAANPEVRLRSGSKLFDLEIYPVTEAAEFRAVYGAFVARFPFWRDSVGLNTEGPQKFALLRLEPRSGAN